MERPTLDVGSRPNRQEIVDAQRKRCVGRVEDHSVCGRVGSFRFRFVGARKLPV